MIEFGIEITVDNTVMKYNNWIADECSLQNSACTTSACGSNYSEHHKCINNLHDELFYSNRQINELYVMWSNRPLGSYCEIVDGHHVEAEAYGATGLAKPIIQILTIDGTTEDEIIANMTLLLIHEMVHTFGMQDVYDTKPHKNFEETCIMGNRQNTYEFYNNILDYISGESTISPFCESCKATIENLMVNHCHLPYTETEE